MGLSRTVSEIEIAKFSHPLVCCVPAEGVPFGIGYRRRGVRELERWGYRAEKEV